MSKNFFDKPEYYKRGENLPVDYHTFSSARKYEFIKFLNFLNPGKKARLIELGCGYGKYVLPLLKIGYPVTAVDVSRNALAALYKEAKRNKIDRLLTLVHSNFKKSVLINEFDTGFCISSLHLLSKNEKERIAIMKNLVKSIKSGGKLIVIQPNPLNPLYYPFYIFNSDVSWDTEKYFVKITEGYLRDLFLALGLKEVRVAYVGFLPMRFLNHIKAVRIINELVNRLPIFCKFSSFIYIEGTKDFLR